MFKITYILEKSFKIHKKCLVLQIPEKSFMKSFQMNLFKSLKIPLYFSEFFGKDPAQNTKKKVFSRLGYNQRECIL